MDVIEACASRLKPRRRRGNMIITALFIVIGMAALIAGIHTMLSEQIRQAGEIQKIGLAKLQAHYLAEMGLNQVMFEANQDMVTANPFKVSTTTGQGTNYNFKNNVAMVSSVAGGAATCTVSYQSAPPTASRRAASFKVVSSLVVPGSGTFSRTILFSAQQAASGQPWILTAYTAPN